MTLLKLLSRIRLIPAERWSIAASGAAPVSASEHGLSASPTGIVALWRWAGNSLEIKHGVETSAALNATPLANLDIRGTVGTEGKWWQCHLVLSVRYSGGALRLAGRIW